MEINQPLPEIGSESVPQNNSQYLDIKNNPIEDLSLEDDQYIDELVIPPSSVDANNYLSLLLKPDLRDLELYIRGIEFVKKTNHKTGHSKIEMKKIKDHFLNEYGINRILSELKLHTSSDIILARLEKESYHQVMHQIGTTFLRLIYKNLKLFGMDTHEKQRNARPLWLAMNNKVDAAYSRSIGGRENDISHAQITLTGDLTSIDEEMPFYGGQRRAKNKIEQIKN